MKPPPSPDVATARSLTQEPAKVLGRQARRWASLESSAVGEILEPGVERCRDPLSAAEQGDLPVQEVRFDRPRRAGEALPRRVAGPPAPLDPPDLHHAA